MIAHSPRSPWQTLLIGRGALMVGAANAWFLYTLAVGSLGLFSAHLRDLLYAQPWLCVWVLFSPYVASLFSWGALAGMASLRVYQGALIAWAILGVGGAHLLVPQVAMAAACWLAGGALLIGVVAANQVVAGAILGKFPWHVSPFGGIDPRLWRPRPIPKYLYQVDEAVETAPAGATQQDWVTLRIRPTRDPQQVDAAYAAASAALTKRRAELGVQRFMDERRRLALSHERIKDTLLRSRPSRTARKPNGAQLWEEAAKRHEPELQVLALQVLFYQHPTMFAAIALEASPLLLATALHMEDPSAHRLYPATRSLSLPSALAEEPIQVLQMNMSVRYARGMGLVRSPQMAFAWAQAAAIHDHIPALMALRMAYWQGYGVERDPEQAEALNSRLVRLESEAIAPPPAIEPSANAEAVRPVEPAEEFPLAGMFIGACLGCFTGMGLGDVGGIRDLFNASLMFMIAIWFIGCYVADPKNGCSMGCTGYFVMAIAIALIWGLGSALGGVTGGVIMCIIAGITCGAVGEMVLRVSLQSSNANH